MTLRGRRFPSGRGLRNITVVNSTAGVTLEHRTRERILALVSALGPITASAVADQLALTATGVRRHLDALVAQGAIEEHDATRPAERRPCLLYTSRCV